MSVKITEAELLAALQESAPTSCPENARTTLDLMAETGLNVRRIREALRYYQARGLLDVYPVARRALDGRMRLVTAYVIRKADTSQREKQHRRPSRRRAS